MATHMAPENNRTSAQRPAARQAAPQRRQAHMVVTTSDEVAPVPIQGLQTLHGAPSTSTSVLDGGRVSSRTARATAMAQERVGKGHRKKNSFVKSLLKGLAGIAVIGGLAALMWFVVIPRLTGGSASDDRPEFEQGVETQVMIPDGSGAGEIAELLYQQGILDDRTAFLQAIKRQDAEQLLKSGAYVFVTGANPTEVVRQLVEGPNSSAGMLTVPEGLTVAKTADLVESTFGIPRDTFLAQAKASNYVADYPFLSEAANDSLEGFLFPKTYDLSGVQVTPDAIIRAMLDQYAAETAGIDFDGVRATLLDRYGIEFSNYEILTMASIVERETNTDADRGTVASVLYNRLEIGWQLQSDATTEYIVGREVYQSDLEEENPYNTYLNYGLTPTPICSPSIASINAACDPERTAYMYFYMEGDYHVFSETLEEHEAAIAGAPSSGE